MWWPALISGNLHGGVVAALSEGLRESERERERERGKERRERVKCVWEDSTALSLLLNPSF